MLGGVSPTTAAGGASLVEYQVSLVEFQVAAMGPGAFGFRPFPGEFGPPPGSDLSPPPTTCCVPPIEPLFIDDPDFFGCCILEAVGSSGGGSGSPPCVGSSCGGGGGEGTPNTLPFSLSVPVGSYRLESTTSANNVTINLINAIGDTLLRTNGDALFSTDGRSLPTLVPADFIFAIEIGINFAVFTTDSGTADVSGIFRTFFAPPPGTTAVFVSYADTVDASGNDRITITGTSP